MFGIPEDKAPDCLKDQDRLNVLFAPLRNRSVNPKDWDDKIITWKSIIKAYCESNNVFSFSLTSLRDVFVRHGRPPACLNEVVSDMVRNCEVELFEVFMKKASHTWSGWLTDVVIKRPLSWSYNTMRKKIFPTTNGQYVHLEVVKNKSEHLMSSIPDNFKNRVISLRDLLSVLKRDIHDIDGLKLLLHYLENQQKISIRALSSHDAKNELDTLLLKVSSDASPLPITDVDVGIHTLEQNEKLISKHVENLEDEIDNCIEEAKSHLKKKHRQLAKSCLVKKHQLEKQLEKKANALHNVQNCLEQLKGTHTNAHVWEAYKNALDAFNTTYKDSGICEDAVEDTMLKLGEALDVNEDIQSALARSPTGDEDTTALEQELEELMKSETTDQDQPPNDDSGVSDELERRFNRLKMDELPDVPAGGSPDVSVQAAV